MFSINYKKNVMSTELYILFYKSSSCRAHVPVVACVVSAARLVAVSPTVVTGSPGNSTCLAALEILTGHQRAVVVIGCRWRHDKCSETQRQ